jgi:hypothetical protein
MYSAAAYGNRAEYVEISFGTWRIMHFPRKQFMLFMAGTSSYVERAVQLSDDEKLCKGVML